MSRKIGQRKQDLSGESTAEVLKKAKALIRTDWGGKDPDEVIRKKLEAAGVQAGPKSLAAIRQIAEEQVEGCRRRTSARMDEAIRRAEAESAEVLP